MNNFLLFHINSPYRPIPTPNHTIQSNPSSINRSGFRLSKSLVFDRIFLGPFTGITYSFSLVDLPQFSNIVGQRIIGIWGTQ